VLAEGLVIGGGGALSVEVILKSNGGAIECFVAGANGKALAGAYVALVPDPPKRSHMALYGECGADASGTCTIEGIAPGEYRLFAFAQERRLDFRDPASLAEIEKHGKAVKIAEGERQQASLTVLPRE
jgi:hypothetical protein